MKKKKIGIAAALGAAAIVASTTSSFALMLDFQASGDTTAAGYDPFVAVNQSLPITPQVYSDFGSTITVSMAPANLPDGADDFRVVTRNGAVGDVYNDWIGADTRAGGTDVTLALTFAGLPAGTYNWLSYHEDGGDGASNGNLNGQFDYTLTGGIPGTGLGTMSDAFDDPVVGMLATTFVSDGITPTVFSMQMDENQGGTSALFAFIGGVEITQAVPEPSTIGLLGIAAFGMLMRRKNRK